MYDKELQIPEWDEAAYGNDAAGNPASRPKRSFSTRTSAKLDAILPVHKRYLGLRRKPFLLIFLAVILALLALAIGLAVGLTIGSPSSSSNQNNLPLPSNSNTFSGDLTYYQPGLGACGLTSTNSDSIVAVSHLLFDAAGSSTSTGGNSNENPLCGRRLRARKFVEAEGEERSVDLTVVDRCTGCEAQDLDTSLGVFERLAEESQGRVDVEWAWL